MKEIKHGTRSGWVGGCRCSDCAFAHRMYLRRRQNGMSEGEGRFNCPMCNRVFNKDATYKQHYKEAHAKVCR